jgi:plasmid rolling circle replication initiator protein Rep
MSYAEHPFLDNIETSWQTENPSACSNINAFQTFDDEKLSIVLENMRYYKELTERICKTLLLCAGTDDFVFADRSRKMLECGSSITVDNSGTIISANFCRLRICPMCQKRRSLKVGAEVHRIMEHLNCSWVHLVLTVPNCCYNELSDLLDTMYTVSSRLFRYGAIKKAFNGLFRFTEITYNYSSDNYHPHFHCLVAVDKSYFTSRKYIKSDVLRRVWTALMTASLNGVDVRRKSDAWIDDYIETFDDELLYQIHMRKADEKAVAEVAKYCVKPLDIGLSGSALYEPLSNIFFALHGRRLIQTYGVVRDTARLLKLDLNSDADDESEKKKLDRTNVRCYTWKRSEGKYLLLSE